MSRLAILILLLAPVLGAQDNDAARVPVLIGQLGSEDWRTRESATRDLVGIGEPARAGLREALQNDDAEVRVRASSALVQIGETFAYAVQCATSEDKNLNEHGRAALMNLFRIDDPKVLRELTQQELTVRNYYGGSSMRILKEPALALAQLTAACGMGIFVSKDARERWERIIQQPNLTLDVPGGGEHAMYVIQALARGMQQALGVTKPQDMLVARPMRLGRAMFLYITPTAGSPNLGPRCGRELIEALLGDGAESVKAAGLLAEGAAGEAIAAERIREEYRGNPEITRLMWLALGLGHDESVAALVRKADAAPAVALLAAREWSAMDMAARFLECLDPAARAEALAPRIAQSTDAMEVTVALWLARGCPLDGPARAKAGTYLASKQDSLASAAARWFAGAEQISDEELAAVWKAGGIQPLNGSFFSSTLELIARKEVADRLVEEARKALVGTIPTQQALAAAVLAGRASEQDIAIVMEKLAGAGNNTELANRLTELLEGATALPESARTRLVDSLVDNNAQVRGLYMRAVRRLTPELRKSICDAAVEKLNTTAGTTEGESSLDVTDPKYKEPAAYVMQAYIALLGIRGGTGDLQALEQINRHVRGQNADMAKAAGSAVVDALSGDALFQTLDEWKSGNGVIHGATAAVQAYAEIARRAAEAKDRATFRRAFAAVSAINVQTAWQVRYELQRMQSAFSSSDTGAEKRRLPGKLDLTKLEIDAG